MTAASPVRERTGNRLGRAARVGWPLPTGDAGPRAVKAGDGAPRKQTFPPSPLSERQTGAHPRASHLELVEVPTQALVLHPHPRPRQERRGRAGPVRGGGGGGPRGRVGGGPENEAGLRLRTPRPFGGWGRFRQEEPLRVDVQTSDSAAA